MNQQEIDYSDIIDLGFKEEKTSDSVYKNKYGFDYVIISKKLGKRIRAYWTKEDRLCELIRADKEGNIKGRLPIHDLDHLTELINFFKGTNESQKIDEYAKFIKGVTTF